MLVMEILAALALAVGSAVAAAGTPPATGLPITFKLAKPGRASLAVYSPDGAVQVRTLLVGERLAAGKHTVTWDGLDRDGRPVVPGKYRWKLVTGPGLEATFLNSLGANPPGGPWAKWVGNHTGPNTIAVGKAGICVGAPIAEGPPNIQMFETDFATTRWLSPHYGWNSIGHRMLRMTDTAVVSLSQDARVGVMDALTGAGRTGVDVLWDGDKRPGYDGGWELSLDAPGDRFVIGYRDHDAVRWFELASGKVVRETKAAKPRRVALRADGALLVLGEQGVVRVNADDAQAVLVEAKALVSPTALVWDESNQTFLVANGAPDNRILRFAADGKLLKTYGVEGGRVPGPYYPDRFAEVADLAADNGRFYVVEGGEAGGGLRRIAHVAEDGKILGERFGGAEFFSCAAAVPGNPHEVYYASCPGLIGRYDFDPATGKNRLTHLLKLDAPIFPGFSVFPHYKPIVRKGQVYLALCGTGGSGAYLVRPDLQTGRLVPVALYAFKPWGNWSKDSVPAPIAKAAALQGIDPLSYKASGYTWSDVNGNGQLDPEEFRFAASGPKPDGAFIDGDFNLVFGRFHAWNHTYDGKAWIGFDFKNALYATLPNAAPDQDVPVWDMTQVVLSTETMPEDPLGLWRQFSGSVFRQPDGRVDLLMAAGAGGLADVHPNAWPTAQVANSRLLATAGGRVAHVVGKHASEGQPREAQFGQPVAILGTVDGNLIVCDRAYYTTAWTADGLFIGTLLDKPSYGPMPANEGDRVGLAGDDWMSGGSIADLGKGEGLWLAPSGDRAMAFRVRGFRDLKRQDGKITLKAAARAAAFDGDGLKAEYFATADLVGQPVISRVDPRLWFSDSTVGGEIVAAWAKDGPCKEIAAGKPFSVRWTGSLTAPFSEPFWLRIYNSRPGTGHTPIQQAWTEGKGFVRVWLNGQLILDKWQGAPATNPWQTPPLQLQAGESYALKVEYAHPGGDGAQLSLVWCSFTYEWMRVPKACLRTAAAPARPRVSVAAVTPTAAEQGGEPAVIRFTLDGPAAADTEIGYRLAGTADTNDYTRAAPRVVIPAGKTSADLVIRAADDAAVEAHERVIVTLTPSSAYVGDGTAGAAEVTILDNDNILVDADLKVYYTFDNASLATERIRNDAGPAAALTVQAYMHTMPALVPGLPKHGDGLTFPKGRESVRFGGGPSLADYTVSFWFKAPEGAGTIGILQAGADFFLQNGVLVANQGGWYSHQPAGANLADGQWHHAAFTWLQAKRQQQLYVDGVLVATNQGPEGGGHSGAGRLGGANTGGAFVGGVIDEFRLYARRLTGEEVGALARAVPAEDRRK
jgi:hypothetical protein